MSIEPLKLKVVAVTNVTRDPSRMIGVVVEVISGKPEIRDHLQCSSEDRQYTCEIIEIWLAGLDAPPGTRLMVLTVPQSLNPGVRVKTGDILSRS